MITAVMVVPCRLASAAQCCRKDLGTLTQRFTSGSFWFSGKLVFWFSGKPVFRLSGKLVFCSFKLVFWFSGSLAFLIKSPYLPAVIKPLIWLKFPLPKLCNPSMPLLIWHRRDYEWEHPLKRLFDSRRFCESST